MTTRYHTISRYLRRTSQKQRAERSGSSCDVSRNVFGSFFRSGVVVESGSAGLGQLLSAQDLAGAAAGGDRSRSDHVMVRPFGAQFLTPRREGCVDGAMVSAYLSF